MTDPGFDLVALGAPVEWPDPALTVRARPIGEAVDGVLGEIAVWLAGCQGQVPARSPKRVRCVVLDEPTPAVATVADEVGAAVRTVTVPDGMDAAAAFGLGVEVADDEVDSGADLLVVAARPAGAAAALLVCLLTDAEPVSLLPRGAGAVDTATWIADATTLRDGRLRLAEHRHDPDALLTGLDDPRLVLLSALITRAVARRTPVLLDGTATVAAALLSQQTQPRAGRWWRVADAADDPAHRRAVGDLGVTPLHALGLPGGDGIAGLLCVPLLRAATVLGSTVPLAGSPSGTAGAAG